MKKICAKCRIEKDLANFYLHPKTNDGYAKKCKECNKEEARARYYDPETRKRIKAYERLRSQYPERKKKVVEAARRRKIFDRSKWTARNKIANAIRNGTLKRCDCEKCGLPNAQAHHTDYTRPLQVTWLCFRHHREAHGQLID
jgi:hypothetical protein